MSSDRARLAVVVPTRDRLGGLRRCLDGLGTQTIEGLDVIVVDDGSTEASAVAAVAATLPGARLVRLNGRGPAAAGTGELLLLSVLRGSVVHPLPKQSDH